MAKKRIIVTIATPKGAKRRKQVTKTRIQGRISDQNEAAMEKIVSLRILFWI